MEIPYRRELFYPSPHSRFSLGIEGRVAYFSNDFAVNCCETIEEFFDDPSLPFEKIRTYLTGRGNPTPGWYGYPLNFHLTEDAVVLDVSIRGAPFFRILERRAGVPSAAAAWEVILSRDPSDKRRTQMISIQTERFGFDALAYASVRVPVDVLVPDKNLAVFNRRRIRPGLPPKALEPTAR